MLCSIARKTESMGPSPVLTPERISSPRRRTTCDIENNIKKFFRYTGSHFRYAILYIALTFVALLFLNIYSSKTNQTIYYSAKESYMLERCQSVAVDISELEVLSHSTVSRAINTLGDLRVSRIIVTDKAGLGIYDSFPQKEAIGKYVLFPEVVDAMRGNDVFTWKYEGDSMLSKAACPIVNGNTIVGTVYIVEYDLQQGAVMLYQQRSTLTVTIVLELLLILFSFVFSKTYSRRIKNLTSSIGTIRTGDYTKKVAVGGNDELTVLGDEFNELVEILQTSEDTRRQFVSDASHELKTPLASIKLLSDSILQNELDVETVREFVGDIGNEADRLTRMTQKLLSLTKAEGDTEKDREITCIGPTMEKVSRMVSAIAKEKDITVQISIEQDCSILIIEDDLYQIIFNLAENGIKYNKTGGNLHLSLTRSDEDAVLQISDTGMGIPKESIDRIFERFYRVDKARSRQSGGSGLGLSIVKTMVERNNGTITVVSQEQEGTTFTVTFPVFDLEVDTQ